MEDREFRIETPVGTIASDSGNHFVDVLSVIVVICVLYVGKVVMKKIIRRIK